MARLTYTEDFISFYRNYPKERQQGLKKPYEIWQRLKRDGTLPSLHVLIDAVDKQRLTRQWSEGNGKYVPMITTWLNQHRWEAEAVSMQEVAKEANQKAVKAGIESFCREQAEVLTEWTDTLTEKMERHKYLLSKFLPDGGVILGKVVDTIVLNGITVFAPPEGHTSLACVILDAFYDLLVLRAKGTRFSSEFVTGTIRDYPNTVLIIICGRYSDSLGIDSLPKHVVISEHESIHLRRILAVLLNPELCEAYRSKYGYKAFFGADTWLGGFSPDSILENFEEVM